MFTKIMRHKKILLLFIVALFIYLYQESRPTVVFHTNAESGFLGKVSTNAGSIDTLYIKNYKAEYRLPYKWNWKDEDEITFFIRKDDMDIWKFNKENMNFCKLDIFLDANGYYVSHSEKEYFWQFKLCVAIITYILWMIGLYHV